MTRALAAVLLLAACQQETVALQNQVDAAAPLDESVAMVVDALMPADAHDAAMTSTDLAAPSTLAGAGALTGRWIGSAIGAAHLNESAYANTAAAQLSYVTAENEMKWETTEPNQNQFDFGPGDQIASFAMTNGMHIKGHTLVWHGSLPGWVTGLSAAAMGPALQNHIQTEVTHYAGKVAIWDVVNEAVDETTGDGLRVTPFRSTLGAGYIAQAFQWAHAADSNALLYYNDYGGEGSGAKSDAIYNLVSGLVQAGVPIHGVGLQMHIANEGYPSVAEVTANMQRLAALGLQVTFSEMDVRVSGSPGDLAMELATQSTRYHDLVAACVAQPACHAITFWGFTDKYTWIDTATFPGAGPGNHPLPFDELYQPKPAFTGIMNALNGR